MLRNKQIQTCQHFHKCADGKIIQPFPILFRHKTNNMQTQKPNQREEGKSIPFDSTLRILFFLPLNKQLFMLKDF